MKLKQGKIIRKARLKKGMTQVELAHALGYTTPQYVSNIERGISPFNNKRVAVISKILKIDGKVLARAMADDFYREIR